MWAGKGWGDECRPLCGLNEMTLAHPGALTLSRAAAVLQVALPARFKLLWALLHSHLQHWRGVRGVKPDRWPLQHFPPPHNLAPVGKVQQFTISDINQLQLPPTILMSPPLPDIHTGGGQGERRTARRKQECFKGKKMSDPPQSYSFNQLHLKKKKKPNRFPTF